MEAAASSKGAESYVVLRLPQHHADSLRDALKKKSLKNRFKIDLPTHYSKNGKAEVQIDGECLSAKLVNLPTIVEINKSLDSKHLYKTGDCTQMLLCTAKDSESSGSEADDEGDTSRQRRFENYPHGLTPPLKNVRKRRFRKTAPKQVDDDPDIEKKLQILLQTDKEASAVRYEVTNEMHADVDVANLTDLDDSQLGSEDMSEMPASEMRGSDAGSDPEEEGMNTSDVLMKDFAVSDSGSDNEENDDTGTPNSSQQGTEVPSVFGTPLANAMTPLPVLSPAGQATSDNPDGGALDDSSQISALDSSNLMLDDGDETPQLDQPMADVGLSPAGVTSQEGLQTNSPVKLARSPLAMEVENSPVAALPKPADPSPVAASAVLGDSPIVVVADAGITASAPAAEPAQEDPQKILLKKELEELNARIQAQQEKINHQPNFRLKRRLQDTQNKMVAEKTAIESKIAAL